MHDRNPYTLATDRPRISRRGLIAGTAALAIATGLKTAASEPESPAAKAHEGAEEEPDDEPI